MAISGARLEIASPVRTPLPYGLMSVAQTPTGDDLVHWRNGVWFLPGTCESADVYDATCVTGSPDLKDPTDPRDCRAAFPVTVYTMPVCSPVGYYAEAETFTLAALRNGEARTVEREFWTGENGTRPHLAADAGVTGNDGCIEQTAAVVVVTGAPPAVALARLEHQLSECYGNEGVIHVTPALLTLLTSADVIRRDGVRLRTPNGHLVTAGAGYPGTGPDGTGVDWMYATGAVFIRRGEVEVTSSLRAGLDRTRNTQALVAERTYIVAWDCCHFAAQVSLA